MTALRRPTRQSLLITLILAVAVTALPALADLSSNYVCRKFDSWGAADVALGPNSTLVISNIGSSGQDGVLIDYAGGEGGGLHWQTVAPTADGLIINLSVGWEPAVGSKSVGPPKSTHSWNWGNGYHSNGADYSELGSAAVDFELYLGGVLVHAGTAPNGDLDGQFAELPNGFAAGLTVGDKSGQVRFDWDFAVPFDFGGGIVGQCDLLVTRPANPAPIVAMGDAQLLLANVPSLVIDDAWLEIFGAEVRGADALSAATASCAAGEDCDKVLRVDNNGISEQQPVWVWVTFGAASTGQGFAWDALPALAGAAMEFGATGSIGGNPGSTVARGWVAENAGGAGYDLWTEFGTQPTEVLLRVEGDPALTPWDGTPLVAADPPTGMFFDGTSAQGRDRIINYQWDIDTAIDIPGRGTVVTGKIEFVSVGPLEIVDGVDHVYLSGDTVALTGGFDITGAPNALIIGSPRVPAAALGRAGVYDFTPSGDFGVANIGSSGQDGISLDLPAGIQAAKVVLPEPDDYAQASFFMVGVEGGPAKVAGDIITLGRLDLEPDLLNIGTIGHVDHGNTILSQAVGTLGGAIVTVKHPLDKSTPIWFRAWSGQITGQGHDRAIILEFPAPVEVDFGDGEVHLLDRVVFTPTTPQTPVAEMAQMNMQFVAAPGTGALEVAVESLTLFSSPVSAVGPKVQAVPVRLHPNFPNPFNPMTTIAFELAAPGQATLEVFDTRGRRVRQLVSRHYEAGRYTAVWDGRDTGGRTVPAGVYFYRLEAGSLNEALRMTLIK